MFDSNALFKHRLKEHVKELSRYLKYIFNGHLVIVMFFLIAALAYYYQMWLADLPEQFPTAFVIGTIFGLLVSFSPIRTLLKEPDLVFLIAAEHQMRSYFQKALVYSYFTQFYVLILAAAAVSPLYFASYPERSGSIFLITIGILLLFKVGNLLSNWWMLKVRDRRSRGIDLAVRTVMNVLTFYFVINGETLFASITTILFVIVFLYDYSLARKLPLNWDLLIQKDQNQMQAFYRLASMFADVPHLRNKVKKRQWLVLLVSKEIPFANEKTYDYLYRITFVRSDYFGMYMRLIIVGAVCIVLIPNMWIQALFAVLFLYLSLFQMLPLYHHHRTNMWLDLYPVLHDDRKQAFKRWMHLLGGFQLALFALLCLVIGEYILFGLVIIGGVLFNILFIHGYVVKKIA